MNIKFEIKNFKKIVELVDNANYKIVGDEENINKPAIYIKATIDSVILVALNREIYIEVPFNATIIEPGEVILDNSTLKKMLKLINGEVELTFNKEANKVILTSDNDPIEMTNLELTKFSKLPKFENKNKLCDVVAGVLSDSIKAVASAIPTKAPQVALNSCCLEFDLGNISFVGFDGYKLIKYSLDMSDIGVLDFREKILIPSEAALAISKSLAKGKSNVEMSFCNNNDKKYLIIEKDGIIIAVRLRDYNYPDYSKLMRSDYDFTFVIDKSKLKETISSITGIGNAKEALPVHFIFTEDKVSLRFVTQDSTVSKTLNIESKDGQVMRFKLLAKTLKDVFPYLKDRIRIKVFNQGLIIITPESSSEYILVTRMLE
jgi:DNA polymerase III sliding clamp (beta) subunit (PCNA family)